MTAIFHLSLLADDLTVVKGFYENIMGAKMTACAPDDAENPWMDFNFYGHQLSIHKGTPPALSYCGIVDDIYVPMPHFGLIVSHEIFDEISARLSAKNQTFIKAPSMRFKEQIGEQRTMFFLDSAGNAIEIKAFTNPDEIFQR